MNRITQTTLIFVNAALSLLYAHHIWFALTAMPLNVDAGYYLPIAKRIAGGEVPLRDFWLGYTPFVMYLLAAVVYVFSSYATYGVFLACAFLAQIGCAAIMYHLSARIMPQRSMRYFAVMGLLFTMYVHESAFLVLEPYVTFFALAALWVILINPDSAVHVLSSGILCAMAFLSKQYGIVAIVPVAYHTFFNARRPLLMLVLLCLGSTLPLSMLLTYFWGVEGIPLATIIDALYPERLVHKVADLSRLAEYLVTYSPLLFIAPLVLLKSRLEQPLPTLIVAFCAFSLPLIVAVHPHYFILIAPFSMLASMYILHFCQSQAATVRIGAQLIFAISVYTSVSVSIEANAFIKEHYPRMNQYARSERLATVLPPGTRVLNFANQSLYYLNGFMPSNDFFPGYSFLSLYSATEIEAMMRDAEVIVIDLASPYHFLEYNRKFTEEGKDIVHLMQELGFTLVSSEIESLQVWGRSPHGMLRR